MRIVQGIADQPRRDGPSRKRNQTARIIEDAVPASKLTLVSLAAMTTVRPNSLFTCTGYYP